MYCMSLLHSYPNIVVQSLSRVQLFTTPWAAACQASLSFTIFWSLLKLCPSSHWCHPTISSSVTPFSSCHQFSPSIRVFSNEPILHFFTSGGESIGVSASASFLPMNIHGWFPLDQLVQSPYYPRDSQSLLQHHSSKTSILLCSAFLMVQLHRYRWLLEKL